MLNLNSVLVFSQNPSALVEFYKKLFQKDPDWSGGEFHGFSAGDGSLTIGPHDKVHGKSQNPERVMFNFESSEFEKEVDHAKSVGATMIQEPYQPSEEAGMWIATFADPDGNYFQIMTPVEMSKAN